MPHWPKPLGKRPIEFGLERILALLGRLGSPHMNLPPIIHIAGTNGKGSTLSFLYQILRSAGYAVHTYTSPHLVHFNERIKLRGENISDSFLYSALEKCRAASELEPEIKVTFFEATTAAAFLAFSQVPADFVLLETGMGGRLDATNVITPILSIITSISLDHTEYLGPTVEIIAREKAGIMKEGVPCIISHQEEGVLQALQEQAKKTPLYRFGQEWLIKDKQDHIVFCDNSNQLDLPRPSLPGKHQFINAGNAVAASVVLSSRYNFSISLEDMQEGIKTAHWPSRLELLTTPCVLSNTKEKWQVYLDGAHNVGGAEVIADWIQDNNINNLYLISGMTRGKDSVRFYQVLAPFTKMLCAVCVKYEPRAKTTGEIAKEALKAGIHEVKECASIYEALAFIKGHAPEEMGTVLICGSLFLTTDLYYDL